MSNYSQIGLHILFKTATEREQFPSSCSKFVFLFICHVLNWIDTIHEPRPHRHKSFFSLDIVLSVVSLEKVVSSLLFSSPLVSRWQSSFFNLSWWPKVVETKLSLLSHQVFWSFHQVTTIACSSRVYATIQVYYVQALWLLLAVALTDPETTGAWNQASLYALRSLGSLIFLAKATRCSIRPLGKPPGSSRCF